MVGWAAPAVAESALNATAIPKPVKTTVIKKPKLIEWKVFGAQLATQADIDRTVKCSFGFCINGYLGAGTAIISNMLFVADDAINPNNNAAFPASKFSLVKPSDDLEKALPGSWMASMANERHEQLYQSNSIDVIRVGSEITLPTEDFVMIGGIKMKNGKIIVKKDGLEIESGTEVIAN